MDPKSDSAEVPIKIPAYIIDKFVIDAAGKGPTGIVSSVGEIVTYQINVTNAGDVNLTNVSVNDTLIKNNLTGPVESLNTNGILEIGEIWTYNGIYNVTQEVIDNYGLPDGDIDTGMEGDIDNTATVDCDQLDPKSHAAEVPLGTPVYMIDKIVTDVAGKGPVGDITAAGEVITYQVNVSNIGNLDLTKIYVNDSLINLTGPTGDNPLIGILNVGETWTYTGNYTVTQADINNTVDGFGFINNTATVNSTQLPPINESQSVPIVLPRSYNIEKIVTDIANQGPNGNITAAGQVITYRVNVTNTGQVNLTNVTVTDSLINLTGPVSGDNSPTNILNIGEIWTYIGNYTATQSDIEINGNGTGSIRNIATVTCDQLAPKSHFAEVPIIQKPILTIEKSADPENYSAVGQVITYTYNVTNSGNVNIIGPINVTDNRTGIVQINNSKFAYITNEAGNSVSVIDIPTDTVIATIPVGTGPVGVAVSPDGTKVYVPNNGNNNVSVISTATNTVIASVPVGDFPLGVAFTPDGTKVYVTNYQAVLSL